MYQKNVTVSAGTYSIVVGAGGAERPAAANGLGNSVDGNDGLPSAIRLSGITLVKNNIAFEGKGGGGGGNYNANNPITSGRSGGSGGGGSNANSDSVSSGGSATQGNTFVSGTANVAGGYAGSSGVSGFGYVGGGGGGAGSAIGMTKNGGPGVQIDITGESRWYAAGGGCGVIDDGTFTGGLLYVHHSTTLPLTHLYVYVQIFPIQNHELAKE